MTGGSNLPLTSAAATSARVASSPEASPRHLGRVVDPAARDDGDVELEVQLDAGSSEESGAELPVSGGSEEDSTSRRARGHAVRERLLARAAAAQRNLASAEPEAPPAAETRAPESPEPRAAEREASAPDAGPQPGQGSLELELNLIGGEARPSRSSPPERGKGGQLSPNLLALFGTLLGLALVASLVALGIHLDSRQPAPAAIASAPAPLASAAPRETAPPPLRERPRLPGPWRVRDAKGEPSSVLVEGQIGALPFLKAIQQAGVPLKEAYRVLKALGGLRDLNNCDKSDKFVALLERGSSRLKAFEYQVNQEEIYQAKEEANGLLVAKKLDLKVERAQIRGAFALDGSDVDAAARQTGFEPGLSKALAKALDGHMGIDELGRGDVVRVIVQEVAVLGQFSRYAGVEALELRSHEPDSKPLRLYWFQSAHSRGYYDASGHAPYEGGWRKPIKDAEVTSKFNPKRMHPVLHKIMPHNGTDFGAGVGTPVGAASYGTISFIGNSGPSGNLVKVDHPNGITTGYAHLSRFAEGLKVGDKVKRLQIVGYVGSTGRSTGPHLHFSAEKDDKFFDAETLNLDGMRVLAPEEREAFAKVKAQYDALLDAIRLPEAVPPLAPPAASAEAPHENVAAAAEPAAVQPAAIHPAPPPAAPPAPAPGAPNKPSSAVYMSDQELLKMQSATDEGEVSE